MPQQAAIAIPDGKGAPVTHTFGVQGVSSDPKTGDQIAKWRNSAASTISAGAETITAYHTQRKDGGSRRRQVFVFPITELVSGVNVVTKVYTCTITVGCPPNSTTAERTDFAVLALSSAPLTHLRAAIIADEPFWT